LIFTIASLILFNEACQVISGNNGYFISRDGNNVKAAFGDVPLWFEKKEDAQRYMELGDDNLKVTTALHSLVSNIVYQTNEMIRLDEAGILQLIKSDSLFYRYAGPEVVDQMRFYGPLRTYLESMGVAWVDLGVVTGYTEQSIMPIKKAIDALSLMQKAKVYYLIINLNDMFIANLAYVSNAINEKEYLQACAYCLNMSARSNSKGYKFVAEIIEPLMQF